MAGRTATLTIQVLADTAKAQAGLRGAGDAAQGMGRGLDLGVIAKGALVVGAIAGVTAAVVDMTKAAAADAQEHERLGAAMEAAGLASGEWEAAVDTAILKGQELAFTDTQIRDAMVPLIGATGDMTKAQEGLALAQDVARLAGVDLETASKAVAKAQAGQGTALAKLTQTNAKGMTSMELLTEVQRKAAGQAEAYGNTATGQAESMSIAFSELTEMIGAALLPVFLEILPALKPVLKAFGELIKALLPLLIPLLKLTVKWLLFVVDVILKVVDAITDMVAWVSNAIDTVGDFVGSIGQFFGGGGGGGGATAGTRAVAVPGGLRMAPAMATTQTMAVGGGGAPGVSTRLAPTRMAATVTHRVDDPGGALAGLPGGAQAVASWLNRGADATGLYRNLQHAAGIR